MDTSKPYVSILNGLYGGLEGIPTEYFTLWSGQESSDDGAYERGFTSDTTATFSGGTRSNVALAVCVAK